MKGYLISVGPNRTIILGANSAGTGASDGSVSYPTAGIVRSLSGNPTVYYGGQDVDVSTKGCPFAAGEDLQVDLVNEILYGITSTTTATIYILRRGD